jgi:hypothetical protein
VNMFLLNITLACAYCLTCRYIRLWH